MKKPFVHALLAALYIVGIVLTINFVGSALKSQNETLIIPMTMLSLFVLSVAVMGYLFLSEPLRLFLENRKPEAVTFFAKTVAIFAGFVVIFTILIFLTSNHTYPLIQNQNQKLNINVVCENALSYMSFPNAEAADKFVAECKAGEHPEVIEHYKEQMGLGDGASI
jgi:membrane protease YdiL (CAAX protease family)